MEDRMHLIGSGANPIYICKKKDVPELFNYRFWALYEIWNSFQAGFGIPSSEHWEDKDPDLMRIISAMQVHYDRHFSNDAAIIQLLQSLCKRIDLLRSGK